MMVLKYVSTIESSKYIILLQILYLLDRMDPEDVRRDLGGGRVRRIEVLRDLGSNKQGTPM
ncbi:hypothetical protein CEE45_05755 [Candidatus Heimdallarchaeota archaeon B3_Heim]|nr:MAG: hypothetical protein CEE45_05755 [Candidatus Heimdallarchaeota archaeon B3_Heim]